MQRFTYASGANIGYIEDQYTRFKADPNSVEAQWKAFFEGYEFALANGAATASNAPTGEGLDHAKVEAFINAYRRLGHLSAHLDPLNPAPSLAANMSPEYHGLNGIDMNRAFQSANLPNRDSMPFKDIWDLLRDTYCRKIGAEFRECDDIEAVTWFQDQMESCRNAPDFTAEQKKAILTRTAEAENFERFLHARYVGQKRFSLEGADTYVPLMDTIIDRSREGGVEEVAIGMAHRGRLNTLCNIMQKNPELILNEFEGGEFNPFDIDGDVKYHMGFASEVKTLSGKSVRLYLSPNPSHLEAVNPVVEGYVRARQRIIGDTERNKILPILIHGDASFPGQGLVAETLNLSQLDAYKTGGTIHVIINNQVGFTTDPVDSRSSTYSSSIAKFIKAPVLHVNADDPEAVVWCGMLAAEYRKKFKSDIVIDLVGYRRHGHNEGDEPSFTQPLMYKKIAAHPTAVTVYAQKLAAQNVISADFADKVGEAYRSNMQTAYENVKAHRADKSKPLAKVHYPKAFERMMTYRKVERAEIEESVKTGLPKKKIKELAAKISSVPSSFKPHPKAVRLIEQRSKMTDGDGAVDWAFAEQLAFAGLASEGNHVRLTGQDVKRGTFGSRHAVLKDFESGKELELINQVNDKVRLVEIANSPLSEQGCMGFEFGYSVANPDALVLWEAQFGDFVNGAQIIIDQFLVASEAKWKQTSGLTLLLPHGYEGAGPEHSSGRPERFLQLSGNLNIQVAIPTTPAQYFHILRRQIFRDFRKPLIIMTPKSLLRHPQVISPLSAFENQAFEEVLDDPQMSSKAAAAASKLVMCTGKIYYELAEARVANSDKSDPSVPIVRLEQLYPFPAKKIQAILAKYPKVREIVWTQEEPQNMGAWTFVRPRLIELLTNGCQLKYVGRKGSGTTAEGSSKAHVMEQTRIINDALGLATALRKEFSK